MNKKIIKHGDIKYEIDQINLPFFKKYFSENDIFDMTDEDLSVFLIFK